MFSRKYIAILVFLVAGVAALLLARKPMRTFENSGVVWTTEYHITYQAPRDLNDSVQAVFSRVDASASVYNKSSLVSAINNNTSREADDIIARLLNIARAVHKSSGGAFDPTVMPLVNAWGFGYKSGNLPTDKQIDSILTFVGLDKLTLSGKTITKTDPRVQLDFSSIAKGFACDEVAAMLQRNGADNVLVEIGGEVVAKGRSPRGDKWQVSIDLPTDQPDSVTHQSVLTLQLDNHAVATSGNYRKFRQQGGKKLSHIVDPHTGKATASTLLSVTIVARDCATADAWATACMAMGTEATQKLFENDKTTGVMTITASPNGKDMIVWSNNAFAALAAKAAK